MVAHIFSPRTLGRQRGEDLRVLGPAWSIVTSRLAEPQNETLSQNTKQKIEIYFMLSQQGILFKKFHFLTETVFSF